MLLIETYQMPAEPQYLLQLFSITREEFIHDLEFAAKGTIAELDRFMQSYSHASLYEDESAYKEAYDMAREQGPDEDDDFVLFGQSSDENSDYICYIFPMNKIKSASNSRNNNNNNNPSSNNNNNNPIISSNSSNTNNIRRNNNNPRGGKRTTKKNRKHRKSTRKTRYH